MEKQLQKILNAPEWFRGCWGKHSATCFFLVSDMISVLFPFASSFFLVCFGVPFWGAKCFLFLSGDIFFILWWLSFLGDFCWWKYFFSFWASFFYFSLVNYSRSWGVIFLFGEVLLLSEVLCSWVFSCTLAKCFSFFGESFSFWGNFFS